MGFKWSSKGDFNKTEQLLKKSLGRNYISVLEQYGQKGVTELSLHTPVDTGLLASSWRYEIEETSTGVSLVFHNDDIEGGCNVAILVQYGHAAPNGYWVQGRDYINPALQPIFDDLAEKAWKEVTKV